jgi:hypothetical protein
MSYEVIRWMLNGDRLIKAPQSKKILYPHTIVHENGICRDGIHKIIRVNGVI